MARFFIVLLISLISIFMLSCSTFEPMDSQWSKISGQSLEVMAKTWTAKLFYFKEYGATLGFQNDSSAIYIILKTNDRSVIRRIMSSGLTIWLNSDISKGKTMGLNYPVGRINSGAGASGKQGHGGKSSPEFSAINSLNQPELQFARLYYGEGLNYTKYFNDELNKKTGISFAFIEEEEIISFIYKIPFSSAGNYNIAPQKDNKIALGVIIGKADTEANERRQPTDNGMRMTPEGGSNYPGGSGMGGIGRSGMGRGTHGGRGGRSMYSANNPDQPIKDLDLWFKISLSSAK